MIAVHEFISLDGVYENPTWTMPFGFDPAMGETIGAICARSTRIMLGRKTFEAFAPAWSTRTAEDDPGAPFFNETEKLVVAGTEPAVEWQNSTVVGPYDPATIRRIKDETDGDIYISGSGTLVRALLADGLVDELHLFVYPIALGSGERFWSDSGELTLRLQASNIYDNGVVHLNYGPA
ncbi:dihydrofolate reductase family protein [Gordonia sp. CPCC 206044]|uniref:dihydrofolate reductase family protein n=1 Tax=Gordonia sp. CPCC 206044 TaxID=3140793 RepID=UPI003AF3E90A